MPMNADHLLRPVTLAVLLALTACASTRPVPSAPFEAPVAFKEDGFPDSIVSSTELMKHAEHCGAFSNPQLNQTGLLKAAF